ncbi:MAG: hypothetical protein J0H49_15030 [Acidobacteria bacterium]|nr:hypothetical protein [Acidobacteriota bacterium]
MSEVSHPPVKANRISHALAQIAVSPRLAPSILLALIAWELCILPVAAHRTQLWYDELLTLHLSLLQPAARLWQALYAGADGMPPAYYAVVRLAGYLPFGPEVTLRLPSIAGYALALFGTFWFVRKRLPGSAALAAALMVALSPLRGYALEARSYALLVGFLAVAAVLWQRVEEKRVFAVLLCACLSLAVASHHVAVAALGIFGLAEAVWAAMHRRLRWSVWGSCAVALIPFLIGLPIALHVRSVFNQHFWSRTDWSTVVTTYKPYLREDINLALILTVAFVAAALVSLPGMLRRHREEQTEPCFSLPELVLITGFLIYPAILVVLALLSGSGYVPRYGLPAVIGLALGASYLFRGIWRYGHSVVLTGALLSFVMVRAGLEVGWALTPLPASPEQNWAKVIELTRQEPGLPIAVTPGALYLELVQYAPRELSSRFIYLADPESAVRFTGTDTPDRSNTILARFVPLRVMDRGAFQAAHHRFLLFSAGGELDWLILYLKRSGRSLEPLTKHGGFQIYSVGP